MRPRQEARVFFPTPFLIDFFRGRGFWKIVYLKMCPSERPSFEEPVGLVLVDFTLPKVIGSEKKFRKNNY